MEYEFLFFTPVANEPIVDSIKKDLVEILTSLGATLSGEFSDIGKRKLAYPIKRETHSFFSFVRFELEDKQNMPEINRRISLYDKVTRHLIVRADEIGKPVGAIDIRPQESVKERPVRPKPVAPEPKAEPKPEEAKPKATMEELDEKLSEILEETPE